MANIDGVKQFFQRRWRSIVITILLLFLLHLLFWDGKVHRAAEAQIPPLKKLPTIPHLHEPQPIIPSSIAPWDDGDIAEDVAICLAIKDQYADLAEWLVHHYNHHRIRRFYIMDDGSKPPLSERDYSKIIDPRAITHRYYLPKLRSLFPQMQVYDECMRLYGHNHKWMGFLDVDEFLEAKTPYTLHSMLQDLEHNHTVGALAVNWKMHSSNNLLHRPNNTTRKSYTSCLSEDPMDHGEEWGSSNQHVKVFVKTGAFLKPLGPHRMELHEGLITVGEHGDEVTRKAWRVPATKDKLAIHHYGLKSREEFEEKMQRGNGMNDPKGEAFWEEQESQAREDCFEMAQYEP